MSDFQIQTTSDKARSRRATEDRATSKRNRILSAISILVACIFAVVWFLRWNAANLDNAARRGVSAYATNSPEALYEFVGPLERSNGVTPEVLRKVWSHFGLDKASKHPRKTGLSSQTLNDPPTQGTADFVVDLSDGTDFQFAFSVYQSEKGPTATVLLDLLGQGWLYRFATENPEAYRAKNYHLRDVFSSSLKRDRAFLESLGLKGIIWGTGSFVSWDLVQMGYDKQP